MAIESIEIRDSAATPLVLDTITVAANDIGSGGSETADGSYINTTTNTWKSAAPINLANPSLILPLRVVSIMDSGITSEDTATSELVYLYPPGDVKLSTIVWYEDKSDADDPSDHWDDSDYETYSGINNDIAEIPTNRFYMQNIAFIPSIGEAGAWNFDILGSHMQNFNLEITDTDDATNNVIVNIPITQKFIMSGNESDAGYKEFPITFNPGWGTYELYTALEYGDLPIVFGAESDFWHINADASLHLQFAGGLFVSDVVEIDLDFLGLQANNSDTNKTFNLGLGWRDDGLGVAQGYSLATDSSFTDSGLTLSCDLSSPGAATITTPNNYVIVPGTNVTIGGEIVY
jgi:hypothetical protein